MHKPNLSRRKLLQSVSSLALGVSIAPFVLGQNSKPLDNSSTNANEVPGPQDQCEPLIQFDTVITSDEFASTYTLLELVNESNYESAKKSLDVKIPDYFTGNFKEFQEKRSELKRMIDQSNTTYSKSNYYHHILSGTGAMLYAECLAKNSNKPIAAWVEARTDSVIIIGIRSGLIGDSKIEYQISGAVPQNPGPDNILTSGSIKHFSFDYNTKKDFSVIFTGTIKNNGGTQSTVVIVPKTVKLVKKYDRKLLSGKIKCGAGCQNNRYGCEEVRDLTFVADPDFNLVENSLRKGKEVVVGGPGVRNYKVDIRKEDSGRQLKRLTLHPRDVEGNDPHGQGLIEVEYTITQERVYIEEEKG